MELKVLGCSGGVGTGLRTTTLLLNDEILFDAGTGVGDLSLEQMAQIRHIFLSHSHLDHVTSIPFLVDSIFERIETPITIHGSKATLDALSTHIFNNVIWPDFTRLPSADKPVLQYLEMIPGEVLEIDGYQVEMIPVNHVVPGVGYRINSDSKSFAFSGDTTTNDSFWEALNRHDSLDLLVVESAFLNQDMALCQKAGHYCAELLAADLKKLKHKPDIYISHNKPGEEEAIFAECQQSINGHRLFRLTGGGTFTL